MIDFHCHLDLYPDARRLAVEVDRRNRFTFCVTTSPRAFQATTRVFASLQNVHVGLGLHPEVAVAKAAEEALLVQLVATAPFIGEIGLDGTSRFRTSLPLQERIFASVMAECAKQGGRVMSMHSRGAESRLLDVCERSSRAGTPVLHWFSGSDRELERAVELDCWFSVGPAMLLGERGRRLATTMPRDRVLPETDGPFAQRNGASLLPWEASDVASTLAGLWHASPEAVLGMFEGNLRRLLAKHNVHWQAEAPAGQSSRK